MGLASLLSYTVPMMEDHLKKKINADSFISEVNAFWHVVK